MNSTRHEKARNIRCESLNNSQSKSDPNSTNTTTKIVTEVQASQQQNRQQPKASTTCTSIDTASSRNKAAPTPLDNPPPKPRAGDKEVDKTNRGSRTVLTSTKDEVNHDRQPGVAGDTSQTPTPANQWIGGSGRVGNHRSNPTKTPKRLLLEKTMRDHDRNSRP